MENCHWFPSQNIMAAYCYIRPYRDIYQCRKWVDESGGESSEARIIDDISPPPSSNLCNTWCQLLWLAASNVTDGHEIAPDATEIIKAVLNLPLMIHSQALVTTLTYLSGAQMWILFITKWYGNLTGECLEFYSPPLRAVHSRVTFIVPITADIVKDPSQWNMKSNVDKILLEWAAFRWITAMFVQIIMLDLLDSCRAVVVRPEAADVASPTVQGQYPGLVINDTYWRLNTT